jgi:hypothetical protein
MENNTSNAITDIAEIKAASRQVKIKHPVTDEEIGLTITLIPESDQKVQAAQRKFLNERLQRGKKVTAEQIEAGTLSKVVSAISGWEWKGIAFKGEVPEFTEANVRKVLKELPWVRTQIETELGDDAAFFPS